MCGSDGHPSDSCTLRHSSLLGLLRQVQDPASAAVWVPSADHVVDQAELVAARSAPMWAPAEPHVFVSYEPDWSVADNFGEDSSARQMLRALAFEASVLESFDPPPAAEPELEAEPVAELQPAPELEPEPEPAPEVAAQPEAEPVALLEPALGPESVPPEPQPEPATAGVPRAIPGPAPRPLSLVRRLQRSERPTVWAAIGVGVTLVFGAGFAVLTPRPGPAPASWAPPVAALASFVQTDRGLGWKHPVTVDLLDPAAYAKAEALALRSVPPVPDPTVLRTMGLVSGSPNLTASGRARTAAADHGYYDRVAKKVVVAGTAFTPPARAAIVEELTKALDDQYFPPGRPIASAVSGAPGADPLVEGDAARVRADYVRKMDVPDRTAVKDAWHQDSVASTAAAQAAGVPRLQTDLAAFPDDFGPALVQSLLQRGGNRLLDQAFADPPVTDGQVVDPTSYRPGSAPPPAPLPAPPPGAKVVVAPSPFGQLALYETLGQAVNPADAWSAVHGWTDDRFEAWLVAGRTCDLLSVADASPTDANRLGDVAQAWALTIPGAQVHIVGTNVRISACDPGPAWGPHVTADPYPALAARAFWVDDLLTVSGWNAGLSNCAADQLMQWLGPDALAAAAHATRPDDPNLVRLLGQVGSAASECGVTPAISAGS